jgi:hypothetical protein
MREATTLRGVLAEEPPRATPVPAKILAHDPVTRSSPESAPWNSLCRFVQRGEKGILILAPMVSARGNQNEGREATEEAGPTEDAKQPQSKLFGFRAAYVFDVTQTEGKELAA